MLESLRLFNAIAEMRRQTGVLEKRLWNFGQTKDKRLRRTRRVGVALTSWWLLSYFLIPKRLMSCLYRSTSLRRK
ncbi:MAG: hypothetical protein AB1757_27865 [Acidobacteriota bacterium]